MVLGVIVLCIYGLFGLPDFPTSWAGVKQNFANRIRLGLDLQGGTHLVLQVQVNEAVRQETDESEGQLAKLLRDRNVPSDQPIVTGDSQIKVSNVSPDQVGNLRSIVTDSFPTWDLSPAPGEPNGYLLNMKNSAIALIQDHALTQSRETIERRIDQLGLVEPVVALYGQGDNEIIVELPGEGDPVRARQVIQAGGQLEIRLVVDPTPYASEAAALAAHNGVLPPDTELMQFKQASVTATGSDAADSGQWFLVDRRPVVTGTDLRSATPERNAEKPPYYQVGFHLSTDAARRFGPFTEANVGHPMATIMDHRIQLIATIESRIDDQGRIEGQFTQDEASDLALILNAGALPASIRYLDQRTVGPSLGADSIRHGVEASIISLLVVMVFMVMYYTDELAYFNAVLTLPGIAGVILTIGMGVDSNVLIFERIREERRAGKAEVSAVDQGFKRAFLTIIDTHVTTVVSAVFLFLFGTGPVKGFAVSLTIGLLANLFTSVYVSRMIFDWHLARMPRQARAGA